jgi:hypothetical protein
VQMKVRKSFVCHKLSNSSRTRLHAYDRGSIYLCQGRRFRDFLLKITATLREILERLRLGDMRFFYLTPGLPAVKLLFQHMNPCDSRQ